jgi:hypothetical protein
MADASAPDDPTLVLWRTRQQTFDREAAERQERQARVLELQSAFLAVRSGIPDGNDDYASALEFAARWARIARVVSKYPDLVHRPLSEIEAEPHSCKAYALKFVATASANERDAAKLLLHSWQASKLLHSGVLGWLSWQLEEEIMGRCTEAMASEPLPEQTPSGTEPTANANSTATVTKPSPDPHTTPLRADDGEADRSIQETERLRCDRLTQTITLDGTPYEIADTKAFAVYEVIARACPKPLIKSAIQKVVPGCRGDKKIPRLLDGLPKSLRDTVRSGSNGYWINLNPPSNPRKGRRRKKGRS